MTGTYIIMIGIDSFGIEAFRPFSLIMPHVLTHPYITVQPEYQIHTTR